MLVTEAPLFPGMPLVTAGHQIGVAHQVEVAQQVEAALQVEGPAARLAPGDVTFRPAAICFLCSCASILLSTILGVLDACFWRWRWP